jgi:hypothetical protein
VPSKKKKKKRDRNQNERKKEKVYEATKQEFSVKKHSMFAA